MGQSSSRQRERDPSGTQPPRRRDTILRPASILFPRRHHHEEPRPSRQSSTQPRTPYERPSSPHPRRMSSTRRQSRFLRTRSALIPNSLPNIFSRSHQDSSMPDLTDLTFLDPETRERRMEPRQAGVGDLRYPEGQIHEERPGHPTIDDDTFTTATGSRHSPSLHSRPMSGIADRISSWAPGRELSRWRASFRRNRSRRPQPEDNAAMLSRLLSVAATATAASLMGGNSENAINDLRSVANAVDGDDGTFDGFLQALRSGRLASHLGQQDREVEANNDTPANPASLDFFRMFRFGTPTTSTAPSQDESGLETSQNRSSLNNAPEDGQHSGEGRMVPILIVGIRALNHDQERAPDEADAMPSFLDALNSLPASLDLNRMGGRDRNDATPFSNLRHTRRTSTSQGRRASMGGIGSLLNREGMRRSVMDRARPRSEVLPSNTELTPPGPFPPPTTPSSGPLSNASTGTSSPSRRLSLASSNQGTQGLSRSSETTPSRNTRSSMLEPTDEESPVSPRSPRQRTTSDTDYMRYGSGSSRRNGMVEPDTAAAGTETNRSWIIYVLGGSYPENHPILTAPSLFTDSPTYEDMLLLSSLLGPAKPPVADREDVDNSGGLFIIEKIDENRFARAIDGEEVVKIMPGENCLVCLSDYYHSEEARRLKTCGHMFHRECIDQWLTTGRNSCPLCRGQGVHEKDGESNPAGEGPSTTSTIPVR